MDQAKPILSSILSFARLHSTMERSLCLRERFERLDARRWQLAMMTTKSAESAQNWTDDRFFVCPLYASSNRRTLYPLFSFCRIWLFLLLLLFFVILSRLFLVEYLWFCVYFCLLTSIYYSIYSLRLPLGHCYCIDTYTCIPNQIFT